MKSSEPVLENILKRTESLSKKIDKLQFDYNHFKKEKNRLSRKESSIEKRLLELSKSIVNFHHDSITAIKDVDKKKQINCIKEKESVSVARENDIFKKDKGTREPTIKEASMVKSSDDDITNNRNGNEEVNDVFEINLQSHIDEVKKPQKNKMPKEDVEEEVFEIQVKADEKKIEEPEKDEIAEFEVKLQPEKSDTDKDIKEDVGSDEIADFEVTMDAIDKKEIIQQSKEDDQKVVDEQQDMVKDEVAEFEVKLQAESSKDKNGNVESFKETGNESIDVFEVNLKAEEKKQEEPTQNDAAEFEVKLQVPNKPKKKPGIIKPAKDKKKKDSKSEDSDEIYLFDQ